MIDRMTAPPQSAIGRLRHHPMELRRQVDEVEAIAALAVQHRWNTDEFDVIGERPIRLGADGSPLVGEFLPLDVAAAMGTSVTQATWLIRVVLNLEARLRHRRSRRATGQGARHTCHAPPSRGPARRPRRQQAPAPDPGLPACERRPPRARGRRR